MELVGKMKSFVPVSLHLYQITDVKDTDSKIAKDKQNLRTINIQSYIFGRKPIQYFRWVINVLKYSYT